MLRIIGMFLIGAGTCTGLLEWHKRSILRQRRLEELVFFLGRAEYALEKEQQVLIDFFGNYRCGDKLLVLCLAQVAELLEQNRCPDGREAWESVFEAHRREWELSLEQWETLRSAGRAFFGRNRRELRRLLSLYGQSMGQLYAQEKERYRQRQRVVLPLGLLGGLMLIVLLA